MKRQHDNRVSDSAHFDLPSEGEQGFLRFTRELNQYRSAEHLLQALPSTLHRLIPANIFTAIHVDEVQPASGIVVNSNGQESLMQIDLSSYKASAYLWVYEHQEMLIIPALAEEREFTDSTEWLHSGGSESVCILPMSTALRRLGVI